MESSIPQWAKDLKADDLKLQKKGSSNTLPNPFGFKEKEKTTRANVIDFDSKNRLNQLTMQKAWQISMEPLKSVPMNLVMSYMSGTSLQIIPIMTAAMLVSNPFKSILEVRSKFQHLINRDEEMLPQMVGAMVMFVVFQLILMGIGLHKLNSMGLFPTTSSDWLAWETPTLYKAKTFTF